MASRIQRSCRAATGVTASPSVADVISSNSKAFTINISCYYLQGFRGCSHTALNAAMATTTESTQRLAGQTRADSIHDSHITTRIPSRGGRDASIAVSAERRLRPVSADSPHETVVPDRQKAGGFEPGRRMSSVEITTAMAHFYRGEIQRSNTWRNRLDTTTNWAVLTAGGAL